MRWLLSQRRPSKKRPKTAVAAISAISAEFNLLGAKGKRAARARILAHLDLLLATPLCRSLQVSELFKYVLFCEAVNCTTVRLSFNSHESFVNQTFRFGTQF